MTGFGAHTTLRSGRAAKHRRAAGETGFTLLELLVVLAILGLLAAFAVPQVMKALGGAKADAAKIQVNNLTSALDFFRLDVGRYPTQDEGVAALVERPSGLERWNGPYVKKRESLVDPWGNEYLFRRPGQHGEFDLYSLGSDGAEGGEGQARDVTSW